MNAPLRNTIFQADTEAVALDRPSEERSDETCLQHLLLPRDKEHAFKDLAEVLSISHSARAHQLPRLARTRLVKNRKSGRSEIYVSKAQCAWNLIEASASHLTQGTGDKAFDK